MTFPGIRKEAALPTKPPPRVTLRHICLPSDTGLMEALYFDVLVPSLPCEQVASPWWREDIEGGPDSRTIVALNPSAQVIGGVVADWYDDPQVLLIGYLAVTQAERHRGIGTALMAAARDAWYESTALVLAEVDDPRHHEGDHQDPAQRLRFYDRLSWEVLKDVGYFQPRVRSARVPNMLLCVAYANPKLRDPETCTISARPVRTFLEQYFEAEEGSVSDTDGELRWLLDQVAPKGRLATIPLLRYREAADQMPPNPSWSKS